MSNYKFAGLLGLLLGAALGLGTWYMAWTKHQLQKEGERCQVKKDLPCNTRGVEKGAH